MSIYLQYVLLTKQKATETYIQLFI